MLFSFNAVRNVTGKRRTRSLSSFLLVCVPIIAAVLLTACPSPVIDDNTGGGAIVEDAPTPAFDPGAGERAGAQTLTIRIGNIPGGSTAFPVFYTSSTDGTEPADPTASSTKYNGPISILPSNDAQYWIKAIAIQDGYKNSEIASAKYTRDDSVAAAPMFDLDAGEYEGAQTLTITIGDITGGSTPFPVHYTSTVDGTEPADPTSSSDLFPSVGIDILASDGDQYWIKAIAIQDGYKNSEVVEAKYTRDDPKAPNPTVKPSGGNRPGGSSRLTITAGNIPGGSTLFPVRYTFSDDGNEPADPTSSSDLFPSVGIDILASDGDQYWIKAIASQDGYKNSEVVSVEYNRTDSAAPDPGFNLTTGSDFTMAQTLTVVIDIPDGSMLFPVRYTSTVDGTEPADPTSSSPVFPSGGISILTSDSIRYRIKAIAIRAGFTASAVVEAQYTRGDADGDGILAATDVDDDNDGLIEINNLDMLNAVNNDLSGQTLVLTVGTPDITGAPTSATAVCTTATGDNVFLCGYELAANLDFAVASDYADSTVNTTWCPNSSGGTCTGTASQAGFPGIGGADESSPLTGLFEGNAYTISNLYSRHSGHVGLFNTVGATELRTVGLVNANVYGSSTGRDRVGALIGVLQAGGTVSASYSSGSVDPSSGGGNRVGGLVGESRGTIQFSHSTSAVSTGTGANFNAGGLVGVLFGGGDILASYATGDITTPSSSLGTEARLGGLVGLIRNVDSSSTEESLILASFAQGDIATQVMAGTAGPIYAGGLVGLINTVSNVQITATYATGSVNGSPKSGDVLGGLVGENAPTSIDRIRASYATGAITHSHPAGVGTDVNNSLSRLLGKGSNNSIEESYGYGTRRAPIMNAVMDPREFHGSNRSASINALTAGVDAGAQWNRAASLTNGAWNFGTTSQAPALVYADYDGAGTAYSCDNFPAKVPGTDTDIDCGTTLIGGNAAQGR